MSMPSARSCLSLRNQKGLCWGSGAADACTFPPALSDTSSGDTFGLAAGTYQPASGASFKISTLLAPFPLVVDHMESRHDQEVLRGREPQSGSARVNNSERLMIAAVAQSAHGRDVIVKIEVSACRRVEVEVLVGSTS
jgi:hypothetical protein